MILEVAVLDVKSGITAEFETAFRTASSIISQRQRMIAFNVILHGKMGKYPPLNYGDRIPLRCPVLLNKESVIQNSIISDPEHFQSHFLLPSARVDLLHFVGVTNEEIEYAK